jgi:transposase-like protein
MLSLGSVLVGRPGWWGAPSLAPAEHEELAALRRENRRLPEDVDILRRATAFFAKETR